MTQDDKSSNQSRRRFLRTASAATGLLVAGGVGLHVASEPAFAAELSEQNWQANDASIRTYDGTITGVTLDPLINIQWSGVGPEAKDIYTELQVSFPEEDATLLGLITLAPGETVSIYQSTETIDGYEGSMAVDCPPIVITDTAEIDKEFFEAPDAGTTNDTPVDLTLIVDPQVEEFDRLEETITFTVSVENVASSLLVDGTTTVSVDSDTEYNPDA